MDDFFEPLDVNEAEDCLIIPTPKPHADLRPNPSPLQGVEVNMPATVTAKPKQDEPWPDSNSDSIEGDVHSLIHGDDDVVIKTAEFHALDNAPSSSVAFTPRKEDQTSAEDISVQNTSSNDAKCFALMGASGGTGVTSLCIQLAYDIAKRTRKSVSFGAQVDPTVCLIDLDFETGSCASYLDVPPALEVSDICGPADRIDTSIVQALMSHHESGIAVLSTPNALGANTLANPETVLALLDAASQVYDHIVIDLPQSWQSWIGAAIAGADHFALVSELTIPSLHTTRTRIASIEKVLGEEQSCEIILNKVERRSFRNSVRLSDAEKALQRSVSATICVDLDTTREAINCGESVETIRPEARYVKDVRALSLKWVPEEEKTRMFSKDRRKTHRAA